MNVTQDIKSHNLCIGCGYCPSRFGKGVEYDKSGFLVPSEGGSLPTDEDERLVKLACPGLNGANVATQAETSKGGQVDHMWGEFYGCYTGHSTDPDIRYAGSSGGALTAIGDFLVKTGQVDGVLVTNYSADYPIGTDSEITSVLTRIKNGSGSKYCPASPLSALESVRGSNRQYAVIARPCDIATLRRAIAAGDSIGKNIKYFLSFFCAGSPSDDGNRALLSRLNVEDPADVESFRHRGNGWPGETVVKLKNGTKTSCTYNEAWGGVLRRHTHSLCKICPDGIGEQADIVAGDAWYGDADGYASFNETDGRSLILSRTVVGQALLEEIFEAKALSASPLNIRDIDRMQPGQLARRRQLSVRVAAYKLMGHKVPVYNKFALRQYARDVSIRTKLIFFVATLRRLILKKMHKS